MEPVGIATEWLLPPDVPAAAAWPIATGLAVTGGKNPTRSF